LNGYRDPQEIELRRQFQTLRSAREAMAGAFAAPSATMPVRRRRLPILVLGLTTGLPMVLAVAVYVNRYSPAARERRALRDVAELIAWRAPTDTLLHNAYAEWLRTTPSLGSGMVTTPNQEEMP